VVRSVYISSRQWSNYLTVDKILFDALSINEEINKKKKHCSIQHNQGDLDEQKMSTTTVKKPELLPVSKRLRLL
jgi:hypothetical protein